MPVSCFTPPPSVLGLALTLDIASPALADTLAVLRTRRGLLLEEPLQLPFAAVALETTDVRGEHAWLERLPGVLAVDVVFVEVLADPESPGSGPGRRLRRRTRDPMDDSPQPAPGPASTDDPDFLSS